MGLWEPENPKITFFGRFRPNSRPNRPKYEFRILADAAGNMAGIGRKTLFLDSVAPGDPFCSICTLKHLHNSFCGDFEPIQKLVVRAYMENVGNFLFFVKIVFFATHATILHWDCSHALTLSGEVTFALIDTLKAY